MEHNGPIEILSPRKSEREGVLTKLISKALGEGMSIALITQKGGPRASDHLKLRQEGAWRLYAISASADIKDFVNLMTSVRYWHMSPFVAILGAPELTEELIKSRIPLTSSVSDIRRLLQAEVFGYLYPLDDELEVHGNERVASLVRGL